MRHPVGLLVLAVFLGTTACSATAGSSPVAGAMSPTVSSPSASAPTTQQWCAAYSSLTAALAQASPDPSGAKTALSSLTSFDTLWAAAPTVGILTQDEADANRRAVADYRVVIEAESAGGATDSPELTAARSALTAQTEKDRTILTSSASKVLAACGGVTETPSP